jgi:hypothetical protein
VRAEPFDILRASDGDGFAPPTSKAMPTGICAWDSWDRLSQTAGTANLFHRIDFRPGSHCPAGLDVRRCAAWQRPFRSPELFDAFRWTFDFWPNGQTNPTDENAGITKGLGFNMKTCELHRSLFRHLEARAPKSAATSG